MSTPPHNPEAVEAAMRIAEGGKEHFWMTGQALPVFYAEAAIILAAEVVRLRDELEQACYEAMEAAERAEAYNNTDT